jgi:hypothetical protein
VAAADAIIYREGPVAAPLDYPVPAGATIEVLTVSASFDGSAATTTFVPERRRASVGFPA